MLGAARMQCHEIKHLTLNFFRFCYTIIVFSVFFVSRVHYSFFLFEMTDVARWHCTKLLTETKKKNENNGNETKTKKKTQFVTKRAGKSAPMSNFIILFHSHFGGFFIFLCSPQQLLINAELIIVYVYTNIFFLEIHLKLSTYKQIFKNRL